MPARSLTLPLCAIAIAWSAVASAAPLDLARVPAKAQWLMHCDMDAARESTVMKRAWERALKMHPQAEGMMRMATGMMGMDPVKDLRDVTAYGLDTDKRNGVLVVRGKANRGFLEKMVEKAPDHQTMEHRSHTLHSWTHKGWRSRKGETVVAAFHRDDVMVFARTAERVKAGLDVLDGEVAAVDDEGPLTGRVRPGSIIVARAATIDPETKCPVLRQGRAFRVALGEDNGRSFYRAKLDMKTEVAAEQAEDVVEGMQSLARLRWGDDPTVLKLADEIETEQRGSTLMISWDAPADDVWTVVEKLADRWDRKRKEWQRSHRGKGVCSCGGDDCEGCEKCPAGECPMMKKDGGKKGGQSEADGPLRNDEF
jgi:hypothetical protein